VEGGDSRGEERGETAIMASSSSTAASCCCRLLLLPPPAAAASPALGVEFLAPHLRAVSDVMAMRSIVFLIKASLHALD
jgi:hypothetical protein